ncbi:YetF domain-containing protein [uncultured Sphingomonas sp.]|nr:YetF domain-containing protein [uncultured Sphingomonas sp.]
MRLAGIGRMDDVARAILETNGKISLICRDSSRHARQPEDEVAR